MEPILDLHRRETRQPDPITFLRHFPENHIQYFDDSSKRDPRKAFSTPDFDRVEAERRQRKGCGVYFSPNAFLGARRTECLRRIQAVFLDLDCGKEGDGQAIEQMERRKVNALLTLIGSRCVPHAIIETKNGLQPIWRVQPLAIERGTRLFREAMEVLLRRFGGDPAVKDPVRVLRLPGYLHLKDPSDPFRCLLLWNELHREPFELQAITDEFQLPQTPRTPPVPSAPSPRVSLPPVASIPLEEVIREAAREAGIAVNFRENRDGSRQIIEDGRVTSGFLSGRGNFCYSSSGKPRRGGPVQLVKYYLNIDADAARRWLASRFGQPIRKWPALREAGGIQATPRSASRSSLSTRPADQRDSLARTERERMSGLDSPPSNPTL